jgi:hypothetical protein
MSLINCTFSFNSNFFKKFQSNLDRNEKNLSEELDEDNRKEMLSQILASSIATSLDIRKHSLTDIAEYIKSVQNELINLTPEFIGISKNSEDIYNEKDLKDFEAFKAALSLTTDIINEVKETLSKNFAYDVETDSIEVDESIEYTEILPDFEAEYFDFSFKDITFTGENLKAKQILIEFFGHKKLQPYQTWFTAYLKGKIYNEHIGVLNGQFNLKTYAEAIKTIALNYFKESHLAINKNGVTYMQYQDERARYHAAEAAVLRNYLVSLDEEGLDREASDRMLEAFEHLLKAQPHILNVLVLGATGYRVRINSDGILELNEKEIASNFEKPNDAADVFSSEANMHIENTPLLTLDPTPVAPSLNQRFDKYSRFKSGVVVAGSVAPQTATVRLSYVLDGSSKAPRFLSRDLLNQIITRLNKNKVFDNTTDFNTLKRALKNLVDNLEASKEKDLKNAAVTLWYRFFSEEPYKIGDQVMESYKMAHDRFNNVIENPNLEEKFFLENFNNNTRDELKEKVEFLNSAQVLFISYLINTKANQALNLSVNNGGKMISPTKDVVDNIGQTFESLRNILFKDQELNFDPNQLFAMENRAGTISNLDPAEPNKKIEFLVSTLSKNVYTFKYSKIKYGGGENAKLDFEVEIFKDGTKLTEHNVQDFDILLKKLKLPFLGATDKKKPFSVIFNENKTESEQLTRFVANLYLVAALYSRRKEGLGTEPFLEGAANLGLPAPSQYNFSELLSTVRDVLIPAITYYTGPTNATKLKTLTNEQMPSFGMKNYVDRTLLNLSNLKDHENDPNFLYHKNPFFTREVNFEDTFTCHGVDFKGQIRKIHEIELGVDQVMSVNFPAFMHSVIESSGNAFSIFTGVMGDRAFNFYSRVSLSSGKLRLALTKGNYSALEANYKFKITELVQSYHFGKLLRLLENHYVTIQEYGDYPEIAAALEDLKNYNSKNASKIAGIRLVDKLDALQNFYAQAQIPYESFEKSSLYSVHYGKVKTPEGKNIVRVTGSLSSVYRSVFSDGFINSLYNSFLNDDLRNLRGSQHNGNKNNRLVPANLSEEISNYVKESITGEITNDHVENLYKSYFWVQSYYALAYDHAIMGDVTDFKPLNKTFEEWKNENPDIIQESYKYLKEGENLESKEIQLDQILRLRYFKETGSAGTTVKIKRNSPKTTPGAIALTLDDETKGNMLSEYSHVMYVSSDSIDTKIANARGPVDPEDASVFVNPLYRIQLNGSLGDSLSPSYATNNLLKDLQLTSAGLDGVTGLEKKGSTDHAFSPSLFNMLNKNKQRKFIIMMTRIPFEKDAEGNTLYYRGKALLNSENKPLKNAYELFLSLGGFSATVNDNIYYKMAAILAENPKNRNKYVAREVAASAEKQAIRNINPRDLSEVAVEDVKITVVSNKNISVPTVTNKKKNSDHKTITEPSQGFNAMNSGNTRVDHVEKLGAAKSLSAAIALDNEQFKVNIDLLRLLDKYLPKEEGPLKELYRSVLNTLFNYNPSFKYKFKPKDIISFDFEFNVGETTLPFDLGFQIYNEETSITSSYSLSQHLWVLYGEQDLLNLLSRSDLDIYQKYLAKNGAFINRTKDLSVEEKAKLKKELIDRLYSAFVSNKESVFVGYSFKRDLASFNTILNKLGDFLETEKNFITIKESADLKAKLNKLSNIFELDPSTEGLKNSAYIDLYTLISAKEKDSNLSRKLGETVKRLGIVVDQGETHTGLYDAYLTMELYKKIFLNKEEYPDANDFINNKSKLISFEENPLLVQELDKIKGLELAVNLLQLIEEKNLLKTARANYYLEILKNTGTDINTLDGLQKNGEADFIAFQNQHIVRLVGQAFGSLIQSKTVRQQIIGSRDYIIPGFNLLKIWIKKINGEAFYLTDDEVPFSVEPILSQADSITEASSLKIFKDILKEGLLNNLSTVDGQIIRITDLLTKNFIDIQDLERFLYKNENPTLGIENLFEDFKSLYSKDYSGLISFDTIQNEGYKYLNEAGQDINNDPVVIEKKGKEAELANLAKSSTVAVNLSQRKRLIDEISRLSYEINNVILPTYKLIDVISTIASPKYLKAFFLDGYLPENVDINNLYDTSVAIEGEPNVKFSNGIKVQTDTEGNEFIEVTDFSALPTRAFDEAGKYKWSYPKKKVYLTETDRQIFGKINSLPESVLKNATDKFKTIILSKYKETGKFNTGEETGAISDTIEKYKKLIKILKKRSADELLDDQNLVDEINSLFTENIENQLAKNNTVQTYINSLETAADNLTNNIAEILAEKFAMNFYAINKAQISYRTPGTNLQTATLVKVVKLLSDAQNIQTSNVSKQLANGEDYDGDSTTTEVLSINPKTGEIYVYEYLFDKNDTIKDDVHKNAIKVANEEFINITLDKTLSNAKKKKLKAEVKKELTILENYLINGLRNLVFDIKKYEIGAPVNAQTANAQTAPEELIPKIQDLEALNNSKIKINKEEIDGEVEYLGSINYGAQVQVGALNAKYKVQRQGLVGALASGNKDIMHVFSGFKSTINQIVNSALPNGEKHRKIYDLLLPGITQAEYVNILEMSAAPSSLLKRNLENNSDNYKTRLDSINEQVLEYNKIVNQIADPQVRETYLILPTLDPEKRGIAFYVKAGDPQRVTLISGEEIDLPRLLLAESGSISGMDSFLRKYSGSDPDIDEKIKNLFSLNDITKDGSDQINASLDASNTGSLLDKLGLNMDNITLDSVAQLLNIDITLLRLVFKSKEFNILYSQYLEFRAPFGGNFNRIDEIKKHNFFSWFLEKEFNVLAGNTNLPHVSLSDDIINNEDKISSLNTLMSIIRGENPEIPEDLTENVKTNLNLSKKLKVATKIMYNNEVELQRFIQGISEEEKANTSFIVLTTKDLNVKLEPGTEINFHKVLENNVTSGKQTFKIKKSSLGSTYLFNAGDRIFFSPIDVFTQVNATKNKIVLLYPQGKGNGTLELSKVADYITFNIEGFLADNPLPDNDFLNKIQKRINSTKEENLETRIELISNPKNILVGLAILEKDLRPLSKLNSANQRVEVTFKESIRRIENWEKFINSYIYKIDAPLQAHLRSPFNTGFGNLNFITSRVESAEYNTRKFLESYSLSKEDIDFVLGTIRVSLFSKNQGLNILGLGYAVVKNSPSKFFKNQPLAVTNEIMRDALLEYSDSTKFLFNPIRLILSNSAWMSYIGGQLEVADENAPYSGPALKVTHRLREASGITDVEKITRLLSVSEGILIKKFFEKYEMVAKVGNKAYDLSGNAGQADFIKAFTEVLIENSQNSRIFEILTLKHGRNKGLVHFGAMNTIPGLPMDVRTAYLGVFSNLASDPANANLVRNLFLYFLILEQGSFTNRNILSFLEDLKIPVVKKYNEFKSSLPQVSNSEIQNVSFVMKLLQNSNLFQYSSSLRNNSIYSPAVRNLKREDISKFFNFLFTSAALNIPALNVKYQPLIYKLEADNLSSSIRKPAVFLNLKVANYLMSESQQPETALGGFSGFYDLVKELTTEIKTLKEMTSNNYLLDVIPLQITINPDTLYSIEKRYLKLIKNSEFLAEENPYVKIGYDVLVSKNGLKGSLLGVLSKESDSKTTYIVAIRESGSIKLHQFSNEHLAELNPERYFDGANFELKSDFALSSKEIGKREAFIVRENKQKGVLKNIKSGKIRYIAFKNERVNKVLKLISKNNQTEIHELELLSDSVTREILKNSETNNKVLHANNDTNNSTQKLFLYRIKYSFIPKILNFEKSTSIGLTREINKFLIDNESGGELQLKSRINPKLIQRGSFLVETPGKDTYLVTLKEKMLFDKYKVSVRPYETRVFENNAYEIQTFFGEKLLVPEGSKSDLVSISFFSDSDNSAALGQFSNFKENRDGVIYKYPLSNKYYTTTNFSYEGDNEVYLIFGEQSQIFLDNEPEGAYEIPNEVQNKKAALKEFAQGVIIDQNLNIKNDEHVQTLKDALNNHLETVLFAGVDNQAKVDLNKYKIFINNLINSFKNELNISIEPNSINNYHELENLKRVSKGTFYFYEVQKSQWYIFDSVSQSFLPSSYPLIYQKNTFIHYNGMYINTIQRELDFILQKAELTHQNVTNPKQDSLNLPNVTRLSKDFGEEAYVTANAAVTKENLSEITEFVTTKMPDVEILTKKEERIEGLNKSLVTYVKKEDLEFREKDFVNMSMDNLKFEFFEVDNTVLIRNGSNIYVYFQEESLAEKYGFLIFLNGFSKVNNKLIKIETTPEEFVYMYIPTLYKIPEEIDFNLRNLNLDLKKEQGIIAQNIIDSKQVEYYHKLKLSGILELANISKPTLMYNTVSKLLQDQSYADNADFIELANNFQKAYIANNSAVKEFKAKISRQAATLKSESLITSISLKNAQELVKELPGKVVLVRFLINNKNIFESSRNPSPAVSTYDINLSNFVIPEGTKGIPYNLLFNGDLGEKLHALKEKANADRNTTTFIMHLPDVVELNVTPNLTRVFSYINYVMGSRRVIFPNNIIFSNSDSELTHPIEFYGMGLDPATSIQTLLDYSYVESYKNTYNAAQIDDLINLDESFVSDPFTPGLTISLRLMWVKYYLGYSNATEESVKKDFSEASRLMVINPEIKGYQGFIPQSEVFDASGSAPAWFSHLWRTWALENKRGLIKFALNLKGKNLTAFNKESKLNAKALAGVLNEFFNPRKLIFEPVLELNENLELTSLQNGVVLKASDFKNPEDFSNLRTSHRVRLKGNIEINGETVQVIKTGVVKYKKIDKFKVDSETVNFSYLSNLPNYMMSYLVGEEKFVTVSFTVGYEHLPTEIQFSPKDIQAEQAQLILPDSVELQNRLINSDKLYILSANKNINGIVFQYDEQFSKFEQETGYEVDPNLQESDTVFLVGSNLKYLNNNIPSPIISGIAANYYKNLVSYLTEAKVNKIIISKDFGISAEIVMRLELNPNYSKKVIKEPSTNKVVGYEFILKSSDEYQEIEIDLPELVSSNVEVRHAVNGKQNKILSPNVTAFNGLKASKNFTGGYEFIQSVNKRHSTKREERFNIDISETIDLFSVTGSETELNKLAFFEAVKIENEDKKLLELVEKEEYLKNRMVVAKSNLNHIFKLLILAQDYKARNIAKDVKVYDYLKQVSNIDELNEAFEALDSIKIEEHYNNLFGEGIDLVDLKDSDYRINISDTALLAGLRQRNNFALWFLAQINRNNKVENFLTASDLVTSNIYSSIFADRNKLNNHYFEDINNLDKKLSNIISEREKVIVLEDRNSTWQDVILYFNVVGSAVKMEQGLMFTNHLFRESLIENGYRAFSYTDLQKNEAFYSIFDPRLILNGRSSNFKFEEEIQKSIFSILAKKRKAISNENKAILTEKLGKRLYNYVESNDFLEILDGNNEVRFAPEDGTNTKTVFKVGSSELGTTIRAYIESKIFNSNIISPVIGSFRLYAENLASYKKFLGEFTDLEQKSEITLENLIKEKNKFKRLDTLEFYSILNFNSLEFGEVSFLVLPHKNLGFVLIALNQNINANVSKGDIYEINNISDLNSLKTMNPVSTVNLNKTPTSLYNLAQPHAGEYSKIQIEGDIIEGTVRVYLGHDNVYVAEVIREDNKKEIFVYEEGESAWRKRSVETGVLSRVGDRVISFRASNNTIIFIKDFADKATYDAVKDQITVKSQISSGIYGKSPDGDYYVKISDIDNDDNLIQFSHPDFKYQKITPEKSFLASIKNYFLRKFYTSFVTKMFKRLNINGEFLTSLEIEEEYGKTAANSYGFVTPEGKVVLNKDKWTTETPIHEVIGHLYLPYIKQNDPALYQQILEKSLADTATVESVLAAYPELQNNPEALGEEVFATLAGRTNAYKFGTAAILNFARDMFSFNSFLQKAFDLIFGFNKVLNIDENSSLEEIMLQLGDDLLFNQKSKIMNLTKTDRYFAELFSKNALSVEEMEARLEKLGYIKTFCFES